MGCGAGKQEPPLTVPVQKKNIAVLITETGEVTSLGAVSITAPFTSKLNQVVPEGKIIKKGQVVGVFATDQERKEFETANLSVHEASLDREMALLEQKSLKQRSDFELKQVKWGVAMATNRLQQILQERDELGLIRVKENLKTLEQEMAIYQLEARERSRLFKLGYLSKEESEQARIKLTEAQQQQKYLKTQLKVLEKGPKPEQVAKERLELKKAQDKLRQQIRTAGVNKRISGISIRASEVRQKRGDEKRRYYDKLLKTATLKAPIGGVVIYGKIRVSGQEVRIKPGDTVPEGVPVVQVVDMSRPIVHLTLNEVDINRISVGQSAQLILDAFPERIYQGKVQQVLPVARNRMLNDQNNVRIFDVNIAILNVDAYLRPGMTANVEIVSQQIKQALTVPTQAIQKQTNTAYCWVLQGDKLVKKTVKTGASDEMDTQILAGLSLGEKVALQPPSEQQP